MQQIRENVNLNIAVKVSSGSSNYYGIRLIILIFFGFKPLKYDWNSIGGMVGGKKLHIVLISIPLNKFDHFGG